MVISHTKLALQARTREIGVHFMRKFIFRSLYKRARIDDFWAVGGIVPAKSISCIGLESHILVIGDIMTWPYLSIALRNSGVSQLESKTEGRPVWLPMRCNSLLKLFCSRI